MRCVAVRTGYTGGNWILAGRPGQTRSPDQMARRANPQRRTNGRRWRCVFVGVQLYVSGECRPFACRWLTVCERVITEARLRTHHLHHAGAPTSKRGVPSWPLVPWCSSLDLQIDSTPMGSVAVTLHSRLRQPPCGRVNQRVRPRAHARSVEAKARRISAPRATASLGETALPTWR